MANFNFKKKFGQNFLNDPNIINKIVTSINPNNDDIIIEIGPGSGALTKRLIQYNSNYIAFEIDKDTSKYLIPLENKKTKIIFEDFLKVDLNSYIRNIPHNDIYVIGNLPYYITTAILEKIIESNIAIKSITVMVQKEVADRLAAKPHTKNYGYMTVLLNFNYEIKKIVDVKRTCFYPVPNVDSAVIQLSLKQDKNDVNYYDFKKVIKESFQFKRKTLINNLKSIDRNLILEIVTKHGFKEDVRAEEIDLDTFIDLTKSQKNSKHER